MLRHSRRNSDARYQAARRLLEERGVRHGASLLDVGCGISAQAEWFRDYAYVGADINYVRLGRGRATHPWALYASQDITRMGFADGAFDAILCLEVIEHLPAPVRAALVSELLRVLAPGGVLALSTPNGRITPWKRILGRKCEVSHEVELTRDDVCALVERAGGRVEASDPIDNLILPAGKVSAGVVHLVAERPKVRSAVQRMATSAAYETILYTVVQGTTAVGAPTHPEARAR
jgi:2-polyprenyl-3-methyl-5-hydroxy-6-metoxy-1,4-benzoquinol methylase